MVYRWEVLNTDTFYIAETSYAGERVTGGRQVTMLKSEDEQIGLPSGEKALLIGAIGITAASYAWGIIDAWRGAERFNRNLRLSDEKGLDFNLAYNPCSGSTRLTARVNF